MKFNVHEVSLIKVLQPTDGRNYCVFTETLRPVYSGVMENNIVNIFTQRL